MKYKTKNWQPKILETLLRQDASRKQLVELIGANSLGAITKTLNNLIENQIIIEVDCTKDKPYCKDCNEYFKNPPKKAGRPSNKEKRMKNTGPSAKCLKINCNMETIKYIFNSDPSLITSLQKNQSVISLVASRFPTLTEMDFTELTRFAKPPQPKTLESIKEDFESLKQGKQTGYSFSYPIVALKDLFEEPLVFFKSMFHEAGHQATLDLFRSILQEPTYELPEEKTSHKLMTLDDLLRGSEVFFRNMLQLAFNDDPEGELLKYKGQAMVFFKDIKLPNKVLRSCFYWLLSASLNQETIEKGEETQEHILDGLSILTDIQARWYKYLSYCHVARKLMLDIEDQELQKTIHKKFLGKEFDNIRDLNYAIRVFEEDILPQLKKCMSYNSG